MKPSFREPIIKVTVGMCVKNSEDTIKEALESVVRQDFPCQGMELVIVDGCSQDNTIGVVKDSLKETKIHTKIFRENEGLGKARQIVVENATGEYIVWVDSDMILSEDFIKKQVQFMDQNPEVGIAKGKYGDRRTDDNTNLVATLENLEFLLNTMHEGETSSRVLATSGCIYRTKAIREIDGFDPKIRGVGEDMDVENRMRNSGWKLHITSAVFYETRRNTWRSLWKEYLWHGRGNRHLFEQDREMIEIRKILPPIAIAIEIRRVQAAYKLTHRKIALFLPMHYIFKRIAWFIGFVQG